MFGEFLGRSYDFMVAARSLDVRQFDGIEHQYHRHVFNIMKLCRTGFDLDYFFISST
jgi:hypothetical protein